MSGAASHIPLSLLLMLVWACTEQVAAPRRAARPGARPASQQAGDIEVRGRVYVDRDGDGRRSAGDEPVPGVTVSWNGAIYGESGADGSYVLQVPAPGLVWARSPADFSPTPSWIEVGATGNLAADLPLVPRLAAAPLRFVVAADAHTGLDVGVAGRYDAAHLRRALEQATDLDPAPAFVTIVGDMTQANRPGDFAALAEAVGQMRVPFVPVAGNHDWYDGGAAYARHWGPAMYSFAAGSSHFLVLNDNAPVAEQLAFVDADLAHAPGGAKAVALTHAPPGDELVAALERHGVELLFTGHWHANRVVRHGSLVEYNTEPLLMGGLDSTPAGYRVVTMDGDVAQVEHRSVLRASLAEIVSPAADAHVAAGTVEVVCAVAASARQPRVRAVLDGGEAVDLEAAGGWNVRGELRDVAPGEHMISVTVEGGGEPLVLERHFTAEAEQHELVTGGSWPQLQGGPQHRGSSQFRVEPPLRTAWVRPLGAHLLGGSPVLHGGLLLVALVDLGGGQEGGVVALDAVTGAERWRYRAGAAVRNAPAVAGDSAVIASSDGVVHALDLYSGAHRWSLDLGSGLPNRALASLYAAPVIADERVHVGVQGRFAALDLHTGEPVWTATPNHRWRWVGSQAAPAVDRDRVVASFSRGTDSHAWVTGDGALAWSLPPELADAVHASPVAGDGVFYVGDATGTVTAVTAEGGAIRWRRQIVIDGGTWQQVFAATPALGRGMLFWPAYHGAGLIAIDARSGETRWSHAVDPGPLETAHYDAGRGDIGAAPVLTGDIVWVGAADGTLSALAYDTGALLWSTRLPAPILSGLVPGDRTLFVATYDGTVRALASPEALVPAGRDRDWGGCTAVPVGTREPGQRAPLGLLLSAAAGAALMTHRRRRCTSA